MGLSPWALGFTSWVLADFKWLEQTHPKVINCLVERVSWVLLPRTQQLLRLSLCLSSWEWSDTVGRLTQWLSTGGGGWILLPPPPPPREIFSLETFLVVTTWGVGGRCYWHLVGRGQRCSWISLNAQDSPTTRNYLAPNVHIGEAEKSWANFTIYFQYLLSCPFLFRGWKTLTFPTSLIAKE